MPAGLPDPFRVHPGWQAIDVLDQTRLPGEEAWVTVGSGEEMAASIARLHVRGAPAIGVAGALGFALERVRKARSGAPDGPEAVRRSADALIASRPTGRNLAWAVGRVMEAYFGEGEGVPAPTQNESPPVRELSLTPPPADVPEAVGRACSAAWGVWKGEAARCAAIGAHGLGVIPQEGARVYLHCNAGALATGGWGTATAPLYRAHEEGRDMVAYAGETRPVLQGARLTAWELSQAGVPVTVVTDSMAAALMAEGAVDLVLVGADAVTLDGTVIKQDRDLRPGRAGPVSRDPLLRSGSPDHRRCPPGQRRSPDRGARRRGGPPVRRPDDRAARGVGLESRLRPDSFPAGHGADHRGRGDPTPVWSPFGAPCPGTPGARWTVPVKR